MFRACVSAMGQLSKRVEAHTATATEIEATKATAAAQGVTLTRRSPSPAGTRSMERAFAPGTSLLGI